jgi:hypothetical protein
MAGQHELARALRSWHVVDDAAERVIDELHHGHATVVVEISEISPREVSARLDEVAASAA